MLTKSLKLAIQDCTQYRHGFFIWRPKSMEKLESLGYAKRIPHAMAPGVFAWEITDAGHKALSEAACDAPVSVHAANVEVTGGGLPPSR